MWSEVTIGDARGASDRAMADEKRMMLERRPREPKRRLWLKLWRRTLRLMR